MNSIESQLTDSLRVLELDPGVTRREINVRYRFLARRLHQDKHDPEITGMTSEEAVELFKRVNNAQQFIRYHLSENSQGKMGFMVRNRAFYVHNKGN